MSLSLYDVLDVDPGASEKEIRAAWKAAIADLGPGDRRFRAYNDAAEVLLDPTKRAAYDAGLVGAGAPDEAEPASTVVVENEPKTEARTERKTGAGTERKVGRKTGAGTESKTKPRASEPATALEATDDDGAEGRTPVASWLLAAVGLVAAAVLAVTIVVWLSTDLSDEETAPDTDDTATAALTAAEQAAVPVLSYDYRTFDEDVVDAQSYMTVDHRAEHNDLMGDLKPDATTQKLVVEAEFKGSGIVRVTGDRADILVMVNQVVERAGTEPFVLPVWATLQMVEEDGDWLVDKIINEGAVGA